MTTSAINNGSRPTVSLGDHEGPAGFVERGDGMAELAYIPTKRGEAPGVGQVIEIEGVRWEVRKREQSNYVARMIVLTLQPAGN